jgi:GNAT superfamily N-acetyltransferase
MIGFGRVITDYVTFGYLTDVFVLDAHQKKGLGRWMLECLNEVLEEWPELRRFILLSSNPHAMKLYADVMGMTEMSGDATPLTVLAKAGPAVPDLTVVHEH